jgi:L-threonylcarbamoyladenylate synthase
VSATRIVRFERRHPPRAVVQRLVHHLASGQLAVIPTETEYALTADATSRTAAERVRHVKGRTATKPFSVFLKDRAALASWRVVVPSWTVPLTEVFWPGPLTLILPTDNPIFRVLGVAGAVGIRVSPEPIITMLTARIGHPLIATSANPSGATLSIAAENSWLARCAYEGAFLWVRPLRFQRRRPSTVLDCCGSAPRLLREGAIATASWKRVLPRAR